MSLSFPHPTTACLKCDQCGAESPQQPLPIRGGFPPPEGWGTIASKRGSTFRDKGEPRIVDDLLVDDLCPRCFSIYKELKYGMPDYGLTEKRFKEVCETKSLPNFDFKFHAAEYGRIYHNGLSELAQKMAEEHMKPVHEAVEAHVWSRLATEDLLKMRDCATEELKKRKMKPLEDAPRCRNCKKWTRSTSRLATNPRYPEYHGEGTCSDPHFIEGSDLCSGNCDKGAIVFGGYDGYGDFCNTYEDFGCVYFEKIESTK